MRKLKLDPDGLRVETFAPQPRDGRAEGTVAAHSFVTVDGGINPCSEPASQQCMASDKAIFTCGSSCVNMCFATGVQYGCGW
ncbi:MAG TPA: hypothetical protein VFQ39_06030 [Longimicrobium sp.]|nr:hypothetical protein [Longimicrobium sp.]